MRAWENGPRPIADRLVAEHAVQEDAEAPLDDRIRDEQQVAAPKLRRQRHGDDVRQLALREVSDVVVLADDEAFPTTVGAWIDPAMHLEDHGPLGKGELRVRVWNGHHGLRPVRRSMQELPPIRAERNERDDVHVLAALAECDFERAAIGGGDEQLVLDAMRTCVLWKGREKTLDRARFLVLGRELVQLVVQRSDALGDRHVLRDSRQVAAVFLWALEGVGQPVGQTLPALR